MDMEKKTTTSSGFTLVEVMMTLVIAGVMVAAIYAAHSSQQRSYTAQEQVAEMQQNIRAAVDLLTADIRLAGYDPTGGASARFCHAGTSRLGFTVDITNAAGTDTDGDGNYTPCPGEVPLPDPGEIIELGFSAAPGVDDNANGLADTDSDGDGVPDAIVLGRQLSAAGGYQPVADNIQAIEFLYFDTDGNVIATPVAAAQLSTIRSVRVSILARASSLDPNYNDNVTYTPASGVAWDLNGAAAGTAPNDNFRRRLLITTIRCRNMGL